MGKLTPKGEPIPEVLLFKLLKRIQESKGPQSLQEGVATKLYDLFSGLDQQTDDYFDYMAERGVPVDDIELPDWVDKKVKKAEYFREHLERYVKKNPHMLPGYHKARKMRNVIARELAKKRRDIPPGQFRKLQRIEFLTRLTGRHTWPDLGPYDYPDNLLPDNVKRELRGKRATFAAEQLSMGDADFPRVWHFPGIKTVDELRKQINHYVEEARRLWKNRETWYGAKDELKGVLEDLRELRKKLAARIVLETRASVEAPRTRRDAITKMAKAAQQTATGRPDKAIRTLQSAPHHPTTGAVDGAEKLGRTLARILTRRKKLPPGGGGLAALPLSILAGIVAASMAPSMDEVE